MIFLLMFSISNHANSLADGSKVTPMLNYLQMHLKTWARSSTSKDYVVAIEMEYVPVVTVSCIFRQVILLFGISQRF